jgi:hypothetical protein
MITYDCLECGQEFGTSAALSCHVCPAKPVPAAGRCRETITTRDQDVVRCVLDEGHDGKHTNMYAGTWAVLPQSDPTTERSALFTPARRADTCDTCDQELAPPAPAYATKRAGKPRVDLLPPRALLEAARTMTDTALVRDTLGHPGYLDSTPADRREYLAAIGRHYFAALAGETSDPDSGAHPLAHVITNAAILLELELAEQQELSK